MFLINDDSDFKPCYCPNAKAAAGDFLFIFRNNQIALTLENELPTYHTTLPFLESEHFYCFGHINDQQCFLLETTNLNNIQFTSTKSSFQFLSNALYHAAAISNHIQYWRASHRFCGKCATPMLDKPDELARICSQCHFITFPKISPCIIVLITRGEEILLARSPHFPPGMMSTLAGFIAIGESVEQCLLREVREEVGIEVTNLKYICSQPWPFPDSLMLGFTAEYVSGEIVIDKREIESAGWFTKHNLPPLPSKISIARYLIDQHLK